MRRNDPRPDFSRRPLRPRKRRDAVALPVCLVLLVACGGGGGGGGGGPPPGVRAPATPNPVGLEFRSRNLPAPAASDGRDYRTPEYREYWGLESISAHTAYQRGYFGQGVTIAVADDGMDLTHPDLADRIVAPRRLRDGDALVTENNGGTVHGTYVAMIAAGARANTGGTFEVTLDNGAPIPTKNVHGVAPKASIMPIEISGGVEPSAALHYAAAEGAQVVNFSIGIGRSYRGTYDGRPGVWLTQGLPVFNPLLREDGYLQQEFEQAARELENRDVVAVWAASNDGWNAINNRVSMCGKNTRDEDGCELGDISVPATEFMEKFTREGETAPFKDSWGTDCDDDDCVDYNSGGGWAEAPLFAPELLGKWLVVAAMDEDGEIGSFSNGCGAARNWCLIAPGSDLRILPGQVGPGTGIGGTSFAAPMVSGALAVLKSRLTSMPMEAVQALLLVSADPLGTRVDDPDEPDPVYGWGRLNLGRAITRQGTVRLPYSVADRNAGVTLRNARVTLSPALAHAGERMRAVEVAVGGVGSAYYNMKLSGIVGVETPPSHTLGYAARDMLAPASGYRVGNSVLFADPGQEAEDLHAVGMFADVGQEARGLRAVGMDFSTGMLGRWRLSHDLCGAVSGEAGAGSRCGKSAWREWGALQADDPVSPPFFDRAGGAVVLQMQGDGVQPFVALSGRESRRTPWRQFGLQWRYALGGFDLAAEISRIDESRSVWGSTFGALGNTRTETRRKKLFLSGPLGVNWRGFAGYEHSSAEVSVTGGMLSGISGLRADGWSMGVQGRNTLRDDDVLRFSVGQKTGVRDGQIRIDHLLATGSSFVDAFYRGHAQSLEQRQAAIDLRARPATRYSLGYALPVQRGAQLAFGLEYEDESRRHGISSRLRMNF